MLQAKSRWIVKQNENTEATKLATELKIPSLLSTLLANRGITNKEEATTFINHDALSFHDPFAMLNMDTAIERINRAIANNEKILVFGDYDADGVTSTVVMLTALKEKGADVDYYIPNRFHEGYGPNKPAFKKAKDSGVSLIITVDTGISALEEAKYAKELNIDLIITDHHEPPNELPEAYAIIHPRLSQYPFGELAGVGVAFKVAHALLGEIPIDLVEFAVIGTISDLVPLKDENRLIAIEGIKRLRRTNNIGLNELFNIAGCDQETINEETIGFMIGPRINAAGRLEKADPAVELLLTNNVERARELAKEIDRLNRERQKIVNEITNEAIEIVERDFPPENNSFIVIAKEGWNAGVIGIVASKLVERYYRPTVVLSIDKEKNEAKGSARSIAGFDLFHHLSTCRDILPHFGGHPMAAGMTLNIEDIEELRTRMNEKAASILTDEDFIPVTEVDAICDIEECNIKTIEAIQNLGPFGVGNPKPLILINQVPFSQCKKIGSNQNHLKFTFSDNGCELDGVGFGIGDLYEQIAPSSKLSVVGELSINEWNGFCKPQIMIKDIAIKEWQLFDYRGQRNSINNLFNNLNRNHYVIYFKEESIINTNIDHELIHYDSVGKLANIERASIVLLDLPGNKKQLEKIFLYIQPEKIYAIFKHKEENYFSTLPTRNHFKWFYGLLLKEKTLDLKKYAEVIAKKKGWTKDAVIFMSQVFFDLKFVTIENGIAEIVTNPSKQDITNSATYQHRQEQIELEQEFIYSSYEELKSILEKFLVKESAREEIQV